MGYNDPSIIMNYTPTDDIIISNDTEKSFSTAGYNVLKEITIASAIAAGSKFRFTFDGINTSGVWGGKARIYRNGSAIGTEITLTIVYTTYLEDINSTNWSVGDKIQLYGDGAGNPAFPSKIKNFRLLGKGSEFTNTLE
jgi:hypothetical protein